VSLADCVAAVLFAGISAYALFGGADFGVGFWDLFAGRGAKARSQRKFIERQMAPVWEANHVWLILALVLLWTCFPDVFASVMSTLWIPLSLAAVGIIGRGAAYAFRKEIGTSEGRRLFGVLFALSSVLTPFFFGAVAGAIASGRVPLGNAVGDPWQSWITPTSFVGGVLAVLVCAFVAALYIAHDADALGESELAEAFRTRAMVIGIVTGAAALGGAGVLAADRDGLFGAEPADHVIDGLLGRALPLLGASALAGLATLELVRRRRYSAARVAGAAAVLAVVWGWAVAQYPDMLAGVVTIDAAAGARATLVATLVALAVGATVLLPSLVWLYLLMQRGTFAAEEPGVDDADGGRDTAGASTTDAAR
jgi:cytochrome bd ubiquinol oxidase subunit II